MAVTSSNSDVVKLLCNTKSVSSMAAFQTCKPTAANNEPQMKGRIDTGKSGTETLQLTWSPTLRSEEVTPCCTVSTWSSFLLPANQGASIKFTTHWQRKDSQQKQTPYCLSSFFSGRERGPRRHPRRQRPAGHLLNKAKNQITKASNPPSTVGTMQNSLARSQELLTEASSPRPLMCSPPPPSPPGISRNIRWHFSTSQADNLVWIWAKKRRGEGVWWNAPENRGGGAYHHYLGGWRRRWSGRGRGRRSGAGSRGAPRSSPAPPPPPPPRHLRRPSPPSQVAAEKIFCLGLALASSRDSNRSGKEKLVLSYWAEQCMGWHSVWWAAYALGSSIAATGPNCCCCCAACAPLKKTDVAVSSI